MQGRMLSLFAHCRHTVRTALPRAAGAGLMLAIMVCAHGQTAHPVLSGVRTLLEHSRHELPPELLLACELELSHWAQDNAQVQAPTTRSNRHSLPDGDTQRLIDDHQYAERFYNLLAQSGPEQALAHAQAAPGADTRAETHALLAYLYRYTLRQAIPGLSAQIRDLLLERVVRLANDQQTPALLGLAYQEVLGGATALGRQTLRIAQIDHFSDPAWIAEQAVIRQIAHWLDTFTPAFAFATGYCQSPEHALQMTVEQLSQPASLELLQAIRGIADRRQRIAVLLDLAELHKDLAPCLLTRQMLDQLAADTASELLQPSRATARDSLTVALEYLRLSRHLNRAAHPVQPLQR